MATKFTLHEVLATVADIVGKTHNVEEAKELAFPGDRLDLIGHNVAQDDHDQLVLI